MNESIKWKTCTLKTTKHHWKKLEMTPIMEVHSWSWKWKNENKFREVSIFTLNLIQGSSNQDRVVLVLIWAQLLSCVRLCQTPQCIRFPRQESWSGMPFPPPGYHPNPGIKPTSPESPTQVGGFFTTARKGYKTKTQKQTVQHTWGEPLWRELGVSLQTPLAGWGGGTGPSSPSALIGSWMFHRTI